MAISFIDSFKKLVNNTGHSNDILNDTIIIDNADMVANLEETLEKDYGLDKRNLYRAKHVFGSFENIDEALQNGTVDQYDTLFLRDADGRSYVGWIDENGDKVFIDLSGYETVENVQNKLEEVKSYMGEVLDGCATKEYVDDIVARIDVEETDPTVPAWAKAPEKPSYTAKEVGARPITWIPSVSDIGAEPTGTAENKVSEHNTNIAAHSDIRLLIEGLATRLNVLANSDDTTLDQMAEVVTYIKANRTLIESVTTDKVNIGDIINNLTTNVTNKPLSAAQGVVLKEMIDVVQTLVDNIKVPTKTSELINDSNYLTSVPDEYVTNTELDNKGFASHDDLSNLSQEISDHKKDTISHVTSAEKQIWNNKSNFSGDYNDLKNKPTIPVQSVNSKTGAVQLSASDVGADADGTAQTKVSEHNTSVESHNDIRLLIEGLTTRLNVALNSTDTDLDQTAEIVAYIKSNKSLIDGITTNKVSVSDIIDNLTTSVSNKPLSAKQGVELKKLVDAVQTALNDIKIPTKTSELTNDSGFLTQHQDLSEYAKKSEIPKDAEDVNADPSGTAADKVGAHNTNTSAHNDIRLLIEGLTVRLNTLANSDDATLDQMAEVVAYIKSNRTLIEGVTTNKVNVTDIIDNLTTNVSNKPLSAKQGVELKALINALQQAVNGIKVPEKVSELENDAGYLKEHQSLSGYAKTTDLPTKTSELSNDSGYVTENEIGGTIEITSSNPTKDKTVLTLDPNGEEVNIYTAQEIDLMMSQLSGGETVIPDNYVTEEKLAAKGYLTSVPGEYITETELNAKKYLTAIPSEYVTDTELNAKEYAKQSDVDKIADYSNVSYGTCSTAASTAEKVVTVDNENWELKVGTVVMVNFTTSNSASNVKLNVNGTGAYPIWYNNAEYTSTGTAYTGYANRVIGYMFNGTHWVWIMQSYDSNTTYTNVKLGHGYATCSTAEATTAKVGTLSSYTLTVGGIVAVKFTNAVPANATLNINSKGAKNIFYRGAKIVANVIKAGDIVTFIYDGTQYQLLSIDRWQSDIDSKQPKGNYLTSIPSEYITETELEAKCYATQTVVNELSEEIGYLKNYITPQMFGAKGDGVTDDTKAINDAIEAVGNGGTVYFPDGTYLVKENETTVNNNRYAIFVNGKEDMTLLFSNEAVVQHSPSTSAFYRTILIKESNNITVKGGTLIGDLDTHTPQYDESTGNIVNTHGYGIRMIDSTNITVEDVELLKYYGDPIVICSEQNPYNGCQNVTIKDCIIHDSARNGITVTSCQGLLVKDCEIYNITGAMPMAGIDIEGEYAGALNENITIEDCNIHDNGYSGIDAVLTVKNLLIQGSTFDSLIMSENAVDVKVINCITKEVRAKSNLLVQNCVLTGLLVLGAEDVIVRDCIFIPTEDSASCVNFMEIASTKCKFVGCEFKSNPVQNITFISIRFYTAVDKVSFDNCIFHIERYHSANAIGLNENVKDVEFVCCIFKDTKADNKNQWLQFITSEKILLSDCIFDATNLTSSNDGYSGLIKVNSKDVIVKNCIIKAISKLTKYAFNSSGSTGKIYYLNNVADMWDSIGAMPSSATKVLDKGNILSNTTMDDSSNEDYLTRDDMTEIVNEVIEALPSAEGVSF